MKEYEIFYCVDKFVDTIVKDMDNEYNSFKFEEKIEKYTDFLMTELERNDDLFLLQNDEIIERLKIIAKEHPFVFKE